MSDEPFFNAFIDVTRRGFTVTIPKLDVASLDRAVYAGVATLGVGAARTSSTGETTGSISSSVVLASEPDDATLVEAWGAGKAAENSLIADGYYPFIYVYDE